jgi:hypothetical protein
LVIKCVALDGVEIDLRIEGTTETAGDHRLGDCSLPLALDDDICAALVDRKFDGDGVASDGATNTILIKGFQQVRDELSAVLSNCGGISSVSSRFGEL